MRQLTPEESDNLKALSTLGIRPIHTTEGSDGEAVFWFLPEDTARLEAAMAGSLRLRDERPRD